MAPRSPLKPYVCWGFDIGGSLAKICLFEPYDKRKWTKHDKNKIKYLTSSNQYGDSGIRDQRLSVKLSNGVLHFIYFQTHRLGDGIKILKDNTLLFPNELFYGTGGGIHKYAKLFESTFGVTIRKGDELKCLLRGVNFLLTNSSDECYYMEDQESKQPSAHLTFSHNINDIYPYILVNIGSGVSILKIKDKLNFKRVSGSQIGGGTFWGLCKLFLGDNISYIDAFELAKKGNTNNVNMLVKDIYGGDYNTYNLSGDIVASAFGKCGSIKNNKLLSKEDIAKGLLDMIAINVAQLGYLNAIRFNIKNIIFVGNFLRQNDFSCAIISWAINYWSKGKIKALFLKHEGYFGALGVTLLRQKELYNVSNTSNL